MQRIFDIFFSVLALLILLPLLIPIAILLKASGEGEIFYLQSRVGKGGKIFELYKFATMLKNSPNMDTGTITVKDDPRVLPTGKFLRKSKINELPQLLNILFGDMSLIGPRPLTPEVFEAYSSATKEIIVRVRPGLSGIGSIIFRGEEDMLSNTTDSVDLYKNVIAPYKGLLERWYVKNSGLGIYFIAIFLTILVVIFPRANLIWRIFPNLPIPPESLKAALNYSD